MKNLMYAFLAVTIVCFVACSSGGSSKSQIPVPIDRELSPYTIDTAEAVNAKNLYEAVLNWESAWEGKEVSVVVWTGAGLSPNTLGLQDPNKPGVIIMNATLADGEADKIGQFVTDSQMITIKGKLKKGKRKYELVDCVITGSYDGELTEGKQLDPATDLTATPAHPADILNSIKAWDGVEVALTDNCTLPMSGNVVTFPKAGAVRDETGRMPSYIKVTLKESLSGNTDVETVVRKIKAKVYKIDDDELKMKSGALI